MSQISQLMQQIQERGYVVLRDRFHTSCVERAGSELLRKSNLKGRNPFEGFNTQRIYSLVAHTRSADIFFCDELVCEIVSQVLGKSPLLSRSQSINILPGEEAQALHRDDFFYDVARPRKSLGVSVVVALTDFTKSNGATVVIPYSHKEIGASVANIGEAVPIEMNAGSILIFLSELWHGGGANTSSTNRLAVYGHFCAPWIRPLDNIYLSLSAVDVLNLPEKMRSLLGYGVHLNENVTFGVVDGMHPMTKIRCLADEVRN